MYISRVNSTIHIERDIKIYTINRFMSLYTENKSHQ